jgi:predicted metal-dependent phosphoesterase TrpH
MIPAPMSRLLRVDLHVHSNHSGFTQTMRLFRSRDCYSSPEAVYRTARARGMDLVTITDHDSIDGCLDLLDRYPDAPDILMGEEIECRVPGSDTRLHVGAFGLSERHHRDVQALRGNVFDAAAFLRSEGVALVLHHPFHFFRGEVDVRQYLEPLVPLVHAVEVRNGTMLRAHNHFAADIVEAWNGRHPHARLGQTGGSDAHVVGHVANSFTEAPGRTREEFLESLKRGESRAAGVHGTPRRLAFEIYGVIFNYWGSLLGWQPGGLTSGERARGIVCSLLSLPFQFSPLLVTAAQKWGERRRVARWHRHWHLGQPRGATTSVERTEGT